jgi:hypothetical protein
VRTAGGAGGPEGRIEQQFAVTAARDAVVDQQVYDDIARVLGAEADDFADGDVASQVPPDAIGRAFAVETVVLDEAFWASLANMVRSGTTEERLVLHLGRGLSGPEGSYRLADRFSAFHGPPRHLLWQSQELAVVVAQSRFQMLGVCGGVRAHGVDFIQ